MTVANRLKFTVAITSAATITPPASPNVGSYRTLAQAIAATDLAANMTGVPLICEDASNNWEESYFTVSSDGLSFTRTSVAASSAGGTTPATFTGTVTVYCTPFADYVNRLLCARDIASFSSTIPLSVPGSSYMPPTAVAGALTFTAAANAVRGALVYLRLTADGTNAPNFSAFKEWGGSSGYDNRNGIVNQIQFFCDGVDNWFSASQAVGAVATPAAATAVTMTGPTTGVVSTASTNFTVGVSPVGGTVTGTVVATATSSVVGDTITPSTINITNGTPSGTFTVTGSSTGARTISITNNGGLTNPAPITYTVTATPVQAITVNNPGTQTVGTAFNVTGTYANGTPTALDYRLSDDTAGVWTQVTTATISGGTFSFSQTPTSASAGRTISVRDRTTQVSGTSVTYVVNAAAPAGTYSHLTALDHMAESGTGPYTYTVAATAGTFNTQGGVTTTKRQAGSASSAAIVNTTKNELIFGTTNSATAVGFASMPQAIWAQSSGANYAPFTAGSAGTATTAMAAQAGDVIQLRWASGSLIAEVARSASPTSFTTVYTWTADIAIGVGVNIMTNGNFSGVQTVGFA